MRRSVAVSIAVTVSQLISGQRHGWTADQELVIKALQRSKKSLNTADTEELGDYLRAMPEESLSGVVSNVKGIYHEFLIRRAENADKDEVRAQIFEATNHPGADIEFTIDGALVREVQAKAVQSPQAIFAHFEAYPDTTVLATSEVTEILKGAFGDKVSDSGFRNESLTRETEDTFADIMGDRRVLDFVEDGVLTSPLLTAAVAARGILNGAPPSKDDIREMLELAGVAVATGYAVEIVLDLL